MKIEENTKSKSNENEKSEKSKKSANGTVDPKDKIQQEELSEEDKALQEELELYVHRLEESNVSLYKPALEALRTQIKSSTTSMTSVPKPLKFLRPHYDTLKNLYEKMPTEETKNLLADIISILAMTIDSESHKTNGEALKFRLIGSKVESIGSWGHEYVRHISGEIASEFQSTNELADDYKEKLLNLVEEIIPYNMRHNAEAEACDLLIEIERLDLLDKYIDNEDLCQKVCLYLRSVVPFVPDPDNTNLLKTIMSIFLKFDKLTEACRVAMQLQDIDSLQEIFDNAKKDSSIQKQIAYMIGRQQIILEMDNNDLLDISSNSHLNTHFLTLARELDIMEPKTPDDIYKSHLEAPNRLYSTSVDSARYNLASSFVNGFVNAAFGKDKVLLNDEGNKWLYKNKDLGMFSATGSLGLILLWDVDGGLAQIDKYLYSKEDNIKAGALLACGIVNSGVKNDCDPALALLADYVTNSSNTIQIGAILGLGLAYAGSNRADLISLLTPVLFEKASIEVIGVTALACGLIAVGSGNSEVTSNIIQLLIEKSDVDVKDYFARFLPFALGLCILGKQNSSEAIIEALEVIQNQQFKAMAKTIVEVCAYAATGNVLKIQSLLHICSNSKSDEQSSDEPSGSSTEQTTTSSTSSSSSSSNSSTSSGSSSSKSSSSRKSSSYSKSNSTDNNSSNSEFNIQQAIATIGIGLIAMSEDISCEMAFRTFGHLLRYGDSMVKRSVPLALALTSISNPKLNLLETLSKFSHDSDSEVACNAIFAMGLIGAGTNNARLATMLRQLAQYHVKEPNCLFMVRLAQGLTHLGKGTLTLSPFHSDRQLLLPTALGGLLIVLMSLIDPKYTILKAHYLIYFLVPAIQPRMLITFDEQLNPLPVPVRVGQAVDVVGQAGKPKTITGFQTHTTPVLLSIGERAELATEEYLPLTPILEGFVILRKNPDYVS
ncbi:26S proteasome non-ATPase regulatory subunit 2 [Dermatophagoides pteronyssinus]|uniref:26S proteasome non-ATPase regulatory subunit 2 n=2 Tax=Dermatophagoides pteronyssinus TaxID=6956 RepID=A0ABQ8JQD4_DERPT|nr:26S proteasome non-ATPase regulatory subunit 2-like [Dermatophagoides pteronyssinus]KAH9424816.1 26S proteasome non-ATPase regulatory subunit 2 [Dermatophagoides pteronyssinus]